MASKRFLTVKELATKLNIKATTIYSWLAKRVIPFYKLEGVFRFSESEIDDWLARHRQGPTDKNGNMGI